VADLPVVLTPGEDGYFKAECPVIPGCISQGRTRDEALQNIREAIELCLENRTDEGGSCPRSYPKSRQFKRSRQRWPFGATRRCRLERRSSLQFIGGGGRIEFGASGVI
jgi:predicted RNase H-like HicB family nuclease